MMIGINDHRQEFVCSLCKTPGVLNPGPALFQDADHGILCTSCGRQQSKPLMALLELAELAGQVGKIQRHSPRGVSVTLLLQLARACEAYSQSLECV